MFTAKRYGRFHESTDCVGVELETTVVDQNYQKPTEPDYKRALHETLDYEDGRLTIAGEALEGRDRTRQKRIEQTVAIHSLLRRLLDDPAYEIPTSLWDFVRALAFKDAEAAIRLGIKHCIDDFPGFAKEVYDKCRETGNEDRGLSEIMAIFDQLGPKGKTPETLSGPEVYVEIQGKRQLVEGEKARSLIDQFIKDGKFKSQGVTGETDSEKALALLKDQTVVIKVLEDGKTLEISIGRKKFDVKQTLKNHMSPFIKALVGHVVASAYANRVLPTYSDLTGDLTAEAKKASPMTAVMRWKS